MTFTHALATNNYGPAKFIVSSSLANGTHTTIAAALSAASSGDTIFIRSGTYTEDITLKAGVNLTAFAGDASISGSSSVAQWNVKVIGKATATFNGSCSLSNICFQTNSDYCLVVSGSNSTFLSLNNCYIDAVGTNAVNISSASSQIFFISCTGDIESTGSYFVSTGGSVVLFACNFFNGGSSTGASTFAGSSLSIVHSQFLSVITTTGASTIATAWSSVGAPNTTFLTMAGTSNSSDSFSIISSGTSPAISIGSGCTANLNGSSISSSNTNAITGAGGINFVGLEFFGSSHTINTTTQINRCFIPGLINTSFPAGDYTVVPSDSFVGATTSGARAITLPASPLAGQQHIVKDITGSAGANNITVSGNGSNIIGSASAATYVINVNYGSATFVYTGSVWAVI